MSLQFKKIHLGVLGAAASLLMTPTISLAEESQVEQDFEAERIFCTKIHNLKIFKLFA